MKTTFFIIALIVLCLFIAQTTIEFKPFKIHFEAPLLAIGMLLIFIGIALVQMQPNISAYKRGIEKGSEISRESSIEVARQIIEESKLNN